MVHFFYFPTPSAAEQARDELDRWGFATELRRAALGEDWLVRADDKNETGVRDPVANERFEALAERFGGEYDGWETAIPPQ